MGEGQKGEKSEKGNEERGREAKRREPKLLIFKHVQQRPNLWALVAFLPPFSCLGNGHISPSPRTSEPGEGCGGWKRLPCSVPWGPFTHTVSQSSPER